VQQLAHVVIGGRCVLVLMRRHKWGHALKIRQSGAPGVLLADESAYLEEHPEKASALCAGVVVVC